MDGKTMRYTTTKNGLTLKVYLGDILMDYDIEFDFKEIVIEQ